MAGPDELTLVVNDGGGRRALPLVTTLTAGRGDDNAVVLDDSLVSRRHASFEPGSGGHAFVSDLGSLNGTQVNGVRLAAGERREIGPGDAVRIGSATLTVERRGVGETHVLPPGGAPAVVPPAAGSQDVTKQETPIFVAPAPKTAAGPTPAAPAQAPLPPRAGPFGGTPPPPGAPRGSRGRDAAATGRPPSPPANQPARQDPFSRGTRETPVQPLAAAPGDAGTTSVPAGQPAEPVHPRLRVETPAGTLEYVVVERSVSIGRDAENDIVVEHPQVSRRHAEIRVSPFGREIADLGSTNGLTVGGRRVQTHLLHDGDVVVLGPGVELTYLTPLIARPATIHDLDFRGRTTLTLGRASENDVVLSQPSVSRQHARISRAADGHVSVEDLGSSNGTFVNGSRLKPETAVRVDPDDVIVIGTYRFILGADALAEEDSTTDLALDCVGLTQSVGNGLRILNDISLAIRPREFVAIVGASGSGKSTLLTALSGFRPAREGRVLVNARDLYREFEAYRHSLGYVPQDDIIHTALPVSRALDYAARLRLPIDTTSAERLARVDAVIQELGLTERAGVPVGQLSGGQRKRVSIGVELLTRPGLFFLDEATSGLDPGTENQMMHLLRRFADDGKTIVLITHATKNVRLCDQVVFLSRGGHLAFFGPPAEALDYFGVSDFDEIYVRIEQELSPVEWAQRYRASAAYAQYVAGRLEEKYGRSVLDPASRTALAPALSASQAAAQPAGRGGPPLTNAASRSQFKVLSRRYLDIIFRDRVNVALLFGLAPVLGAVDLLAWPRNVLDPFDGDTPKTMSMLFIAAIVPFLVGSLSSVREIVKEASIYKRERAVAVEIGPYLLSKAAVGALFAFYHATALLLVKLLAVDLGPMGNGVILVWLFLFMAAFSGVLWGLLISAWAKREEHAMLLVIGLVVLQIVFSGALFSLSGPAGQVIGATSTTHWTFAGITTAAGISVDDCQESLADCELPGIRQKRGPEQQGSVDNLDERYGSVIDLPVGVPVIALVVSGVVILGVLAWLQKRKDVV